MPAIDCASIRTLAQRSASVDSLALGSDQRLFFVEGGQRIGVIAASGLLPQFVLAANRPSLRFTQLELDPAFVLSGLLFVGEIEAYADGRREFRVARYRLAHDGAGERAVLLNLPLGPSGDALFALDPTGYIFVAMPAGGANPSGSVLRANLDGTVPHEQRGSLVIASGYAAPTALVVEPRSRALWMAGIDTGQRPSLTTLGTDGLPRTFALLAPAIALSTFAAGFDDISVLLASEEGTLAAVQLKADGSVGTVWSVRLPAGPVRNVTTAPSGDLYVVTTTGTMSSILNLPSAP
jgi:hypothetical protein